jgi:DNA repair exonuclease SbcCD ATPase subunit
MKNEKKEISMVNNINVPQNARIKVYWSDAPENYSREAKNRVQKYFSKKYGVDKNNIQVEYRPIKIGNDGKLIHIEGSSIENIMDINYQRKLFNEWITRNNKTVDIERLYALDSKVNGELNMSEQEIVGKRYSIKWITLNNFLSFGENNVLPVSRFKGLTVVNSSPSNASGKTSLVVDSVKYLLFGNTTKTDKNEEIFNQYSDGTELIVRGMIDIDGEGEIIIERNMKRSKNKKGGWNIKNSLNYYKILPDGTEELLNDEHAIKTTQQIADVVGTEKDFELIVLATARNLDDLIDFTSGESGKLLTRFIGLDIIESKEQIARNMYNEFSKTMKSNHYNIETLNEEIEAHKENIIKLNEGKITIDADLLVQNNLLISLNEEKTTKISNKIKIDVEILTLNPTKIQSDIDKLIKDGISYKDKIDKVDIKIKEIGPLSFDEDKHYEVTNKVNTLNTNIALKTAEIDRLTKVIQGLIDGGICQTCKRALDDVDNTEHINQHQSEINAHNEQLKTLNSDLIKYTDELTQLNKVKKLVDEVSTLQLDKSRYEVEIKSIKTDIKSKKLDLKNYQDNLSAIETNKAIDIDISNIETKISVAQNQRDNLNSKLQINGIDIESNNQSIIDKTKLIKQINKERDIEIIYKLYIEMVGKKGINKLVLRSVLPIINSELQRLLDDVTDFEVEISIDDKNEVKFLLVRDGIEKALKSGSGFERTASSLALRCVLGKMSKLSMPNFITFDEVLGRVAIDNIERMKLLFDKITEKYENVFFITQNDIVKDWADNIITVVKENNISKIQIN